MQIGRFIILFLIIAVIFPSIDVGALFGLFLFMLGVAAINRSANANGRRWNVWDALTRGTFNNRLQSEGRQIHRHALQAFRRAGHNPDQQSAVMPGDVGVIVYLENQLPAIYRTDAIPDVADSIQPYLGIYLNVPEARGLIRFEIVDGNNQPVFIYEDEQSLKQGYNLITPPSRLPLRGIQALTSTWRLRISADGILLAEHPLKWQLSSEFSRIVGADGELTDELRRAATQNTPRMSLDDLLAMQPQSDAMTEQEAAAQHTRRIGHLLSRR